MNVCAGEPVMLAADVDHLPNIMAYQWYAKVDTGATVEIDTLADAIAPIYYFTADITRTFYFEATIGTGCKVSSNEVTVTVTADTIPIAVTPVFTNATKDTTICSGNLIAFTATVESTIDLAWYINGQAVSGATHSEFIYQFNTPGTFIVSVLATRPSSTGCGSAMKTVGTIIVGASPTVTIVGPELVCNTATNPATLFAKVIPVPTATSRIGYQWYKNGALLVDSTNATITIDTTASPNPYSYLVQIIDSASGCTAISQIQTVYVEQHPVIGITADKTQMCVGDIVTLTAAVSGNSNITYQWYIVSDTGNVAIPGATAPVLHNTPDSTTTYTFRATQIDSGCEATSNNILVVVISEFALEVVTDTAFNICAGSQVTFTVKDTTNASNASTFTWYVNAQPIAGQTHATLTYQFGYPGVFNVTAMATTNLGSCPSAVVDVATVTVGMPFGVTVEGPELVCNTTNPTYLYAHVTPLNLIDTNLVYQWYVNGVEIPGADSSAVLIDTVASPYPYIYFVHIKDTVSGCETTSQVQTVYVEAHPVIGIIADKMQVCKGEIVTLTANISNVSNMNYQWYVVSDTGTTVIPGANAPIYHLTADTTASYTFTATQLVSDCQATSNTVTVAVMSNLTVNAEPLDTTICAGSQVGFSADGAIAYAWAINGVIVDGAADSAFTYRFDHPGIYTVAVSGAGCTVSMQNVGTVTVKSAPVVEIAGAELVCDAASPVSLYAIVTPILTNTYTYQWYVDGESAGGDYDTITIANAPRPNPYIYVVAVTDTTSGCTVTSATHLVYVEQFPVIGITADKIQACAGDIVMLSANVSGASNMEYQWYHTVAGVADPVEISGANAPILYVEVDSTRTYTFTATQIGSECQATSNEVTIAVMGTTAGIAVQDITMVPTNGIICDGGQVVLTANVQNSDSVAYYVWFVNGIEIPGQNLATILVSPTTVDFDTTNYIYNVVAVPHGGIICLSGMGDAAEARVHVMRNPIVEIHGQNHICDTYLGLKPLPGEVRPPNLSIIGYVNAAYYSDHCVGANPTYMNYTWYIDGTIYDLGGVAACDAQHLNIHLTSRYEPYLIQMQYNAGFGCSAYSQVFEVYSYPAPIVNVTSTEDTICEGGSVTLRANLNDYNITGYTYQWYKGGLAAANLIPGATEPIYTTPAINETGTIKYYVEVIHTATFDLSDPAKKCLVIASYELFAYPKPTIDQIAVSVNQICSGGQVIITATPSANNFGNNPVYTWYKNGQIVDGATGSWFLDSPLAVDNDETVYIYNAIVSYENSGCTSVLNDNIADTVTVYRNPIVAIDGDAHVCETSPVFLCAYVDHSSNPVGDLTYTWYQSGEPRENTLLSAPGQCYAERWAPRYEPYEFTVEVTRGNGCTSFSEKFYVWVHTSPEVNITASETVICEGGTVELTANLNNYTTEHITYQWYEVTYNLDSIFAFGAWTYFVDTASTLIPGATQQTYNPGALYDTIAVFAVEVIQAHSLCIATDVIEIKITPKPIVLFGDELQNDTICAGHQATLMVVTTIAGDTVTNVTYQWYVNGAAIPGATTDTYSPILTVAGDYIYEVQAFVPISGCISERTLVGTIMVKDAPAVVIAGPSIICNSAEGAQLYAIIDPVKADLTYQWFLNGVEIPNAEGDTLNIDDLDASPYPYNYTVEITDPESGCVILSAVHSVRVDQFPVIAITADPMMICAGELVTLKAEIQADPNIIYQWYATVGTTTDTITNANAPIYHANPTETTTYKFTATQIESGCVATSNDVIVKVTPTPSITNTEVDTDTICKGEQVTFTAIASTPNTITTYTWTVNGQVVEGATDSILTYTFNHYGVFDVSAVATTQVLGQATACSSLVKLIATITVKDAPAVVIAGPSIICDTAKGAKLHAIVDPAGATVTYQWFLNGAEISGAEGDSLNINNLTASPFPYNYTVQITDTESGCVILSAVHSVTVNQFPVIAITATPTVVCGGDEVILRAETQNDPNIIYKWYANDTLIANANAPVWYVYPNKTTVYTFTATQIESGCVATSNPVTVTIIPKPIITITKIDTTICEGEQLTFTATLTTPDPVVYTWRVAGQTIIDATTNVLTYTFNQYGVYDVEVFATSIGAGCRSDVMNAGTITVKEAPTVIITGPHTICENAIGAKLTATVFPHNTNVGYQWFLDGVAIPGATDSVYSISGLTASPMPYSFTVVITDPESDCDGHSLPYAVTVYTFTNVSITATPSEICDGETVTLEADITPLPTVNMTYQWFDNGNPIDGATGPAFQYVPFEIGVHKYTFVATQIGSGCTAHSNEVIVNVKPIPATPALTISATQICSGNQVTITGNVDGYYTWYVGGVKFAEGTEKSITIAPTADNNLMTYTYTADVVVDACTSDRSASVSVTVHPAISVTLTGQDKVCFQAVEDEQLVLHAQVVTSQPGVNYLYTLKYAKGQNQPMVVGVYTIPDMIVPNTLEPNDPADPYCFFVEVTAIGYGCTATSAYHCVNILPQPEVDLYVDNTAICLGGTITVTADPRPAATPGNPYDYEWFLNGTPIPGNVNEITITNGFVLGVNEITVNFVRTQDGYACSGSNSILVNVLAAPALTLTHDFENGIPLPGICVGGKVNLYTAIANFDVNLIDVEGFKYEWRRNSQPLAHEYSFLTEELNTPGTYKYEVRAYNSELGCYSPWTAFEDIIVAPQPTVEIYTVDNTLHAVCQGAQLTFFATLNANPIVYQTGDFVWSSGLTGLIDNNTIRPDKDVVFNNIGVTTHSIKVMFQNPTCAIAEDAINITVTTQPEWTVLSIEDDPYAGVCLGTKLTLKAEFKGGVDEDINVGRIQWEYKVDGGAWIKLQALGGHQTHTPTEAGLYTYRVTYIPTNERAGCELAPYEFTSFQVFPTPSATFNTELSNLQSCANNPFADVTLVVDLVGTPPFTFVVKRNNGSPETETYRDIWTTPYTINVKPIPSATTQFTITSLIDGSGCTNVVLDDVIVRVTNINIIDADVITCEPTFDVRLNITEAVDKDAVVTFEGFDSETYTIKPQGNNSVITVNVPEEAFKQGGDYNVSIKIDGCEYWIKVKVGVAATAEFDLEKTTQQICGNDPTVTKVDLHIKFTGTPPFHYTLVGTDGTRTGNIISFKYEEVYTVTPVATTTYTIEFLEDDLNCANNNFVRPEITITVTDVKVVTPEILACDNQIAVTIQVISAVSDVAFVAFDSEEPVSYTIRQGLNTLSVRIPNYLTYGTHTVTLTVDGCIYTFDVIYGASGSGANALVHRRWEGYGEVVVVSNNYTDPANQYYNGGYMFTSYQWYKNGEIIPGATQQYYQDPNGVNGIYSVRLTGYKVDVNGNRLSDQITFTTCGVEFNPTSTVKVYPVPAQVNQPVTVELDMTPAELEGAVLDIYDAKGAHIQHIPVVSSKTQVDGFKAQGTYFGRITTGTNETKAIKFVIVK
ncbi:MAG: hypothetical protein FWC34_10300 [Bacteroidetes bacterium]|nr:hypothetical protein [Bacteroidota bacterium]